MNRKERIVDVKSQASLCSCEEKLTTAKSVFRFGRKSEVDVPNLGMQFAAAN